MNFQNVPKGDTIVRSAFGPKLEALASWDYDAIEYRLLAYYLTFVGYDYMVEEFKAGKDPHVETARALLGLTGEVSKTERAVGKTGNFLAIYGGGVYKLQEMLALNGYPVTLAGAKDLWNEYHRLRPGIRDLSNPKPRKRVANYRPGLIERKLEHSGYIKTLWGRHLRPEQPHKALNALIQGCAADLMRQALVNLARWRREHPDMVSHPVLTIHDDITWDVLLSELPFLAYHVPRLMTDERLEAVLPITAGLEVTTTTWADMKPWEEAA